MKGIRKVRSREARRSLDPRLQPHASAGSWLLVLGLLLSGGGCAAASTGAAPATADEIVGMLHASAEGWNAGDLDRFLEPYLDSPSGVTFIGGSGLVRGKAAIEALYRRSYWKDGRPEDTLRFTSLEVRPLGRDHALATGRYEVSDPTGARTGEGPFTLVLVRTRTGWRIIHDHSS